MRRILLGLIGTAVGTAMLVGYKAGPTGADIAAASAPQDPAGDPSAGPGPTGGPGQPAGPTVPGPTATPPGQGGASPTAPTGTTTAPPHTTAPPASRTISGTAVAARTAKSPSCGECSGNMQVRIVVTGKHIDSIQTIQQSNRPLSVASTLSKQALTAQSANVGNISGATYSALAWKQSLQSAINQI